MRLEKTEFSTKLIDLYGEYYQDNIVSGKCYWNWFNEEEEIYKLTNEHWHLVKVTYVRSYVAFYVIPGFEDRIPESSFMIGSFMSRQLEPEYLDPLTDLKHFDLDFNDYCFDDSRTKILNFKNDKYIDIEESEVVEKINELKGYLL